MDVCILMWNWNAYRGNTIFFLDLTTIFLLNSVFDFKNGEKWYNGATYTSSQIFYVFFCIIFILITFMSDILFVYFQKNFNFQFSSFLNFPQFFNFFIFSFLSFSGSFHQFFRIKWWIKLEKIHNFFSIAEFIPFYSPSNLFRTIQFVLNGILGKKRFKLLKCM